MSYKNWVKKAQQRQEVVDIDLALWTQLKNSKCYYCQVEPHLLPIFYQRLDLKRTPWMTIDRKDNSRGYVRDNVVSCCFNCNRIKGSFFSPEEMLFIAENIIKPKLQKYDEEVWDEYVENVPLMEGDYYDTEVPSSKNRR